MPRILWLIALGLLLACGKTAPSSPPGPTPPTSNPPTEPPTPAGAVAVLALNGTSGHGVAPDTESFDGSASYSKDSTAHITDYQWSFGDGSATATGAQVSHTFTQPGAYAVTLTVTDSEGSTATASLPVQVDAPPRPPHDVIAVARLDGTSGSGPAPDTERFDGTGSSTTEATASIAVCHWDFGDGQSATGCKATHTFQNSGDFTVTLTVTDTDGASGSASLQVHVTEPTQSTGVVAVASLDGTPGHGIAPDTEAFDGTGSHSRDPAAHLVSCAWDFGDGARASGCKTRHTFTETGDFIVTLTATDSDGASATATLTIQVDASTTNRVRWARTFPSTALVGSDFGDQIAFAYEAEIGMLDPSTGAVLWAYDFTPSPANPYEPYVFRGGLFVLPGTHQIAAESAMGGAYAYADIFRYLPDGSRQRIGGGLEDEGSFSSLAMSANGLLSWGFSGFVGAYATLARPDDTQWMATLTSQPAGNVHVVDTAPEPGGDLLVAVDVTDPFTFDGQAFPLGPAWMRVDPRGHLVWWTSTPFSTMDLGTTTAGTVVAVVQSKNDFVWGDSHAAGTALVVSEWDGQPRLVRQLASAQWAELSVLPAGRVAIAINRTGCQGGLVYRFDLAGNESWRHDFGAFGCDVTLAGVAIRPDDVMVSGALAVPEDLGRGTLPAGGFVLDLEGAD